MAGGPLGRRRKTDGCNVDENKFERPIPTSRDGQKLKNSSRAVGTEALCGKESDGARMLRKKSSLFSPTISSSRKENTEKQKDHPAQVQEIKPRFKVGSDSQPIMVNRVKDAPAPRRSPLPVAERIKKTSATPRILKEKLAIPISGHQSQSAARNTKSSTIQKTPSTTQLPQKKKQSETPVHQPKFEKAPTSQPSRLRNHKQNSLTQSQPSNQYVRRSGTQKTSVPPQVSAGKKVSRKAISQSRPSKSTMKHSRTTERDLRHEEPIHHIFWEDPDETCDTGIICPVCEEDLSSMPDDYADDYADGYYDDVDVSLLPNVSILPCGHSFHSVCLDSPSLEDDSGVPTCYFCLSCES